MFGECARSWQHLRCDKRATCRASAARKYSACKDLRTQDMRTAGMAAHSLHSGWRFHFDDGSCAASQVLDNTALNRIATQQLRTDNPSVQVGLMMAPLTGSLTCHLTKAHASMRAVHHA